MSSTTPFPEIPLEGRNYVALLRANCRLIDALTEDAKPEEAMRETFDDVMEGFGADRGLILGVSPGLELEILCHKGIKGDDLAAIKQNETATGISSKMIRKVVGEKHAILMQHPLMQTEAERTAAFELETPGGRGRNYSAMCAPVLNFMGRDVRGLYYFQNQGSDLRRAYRLSDLEFLTGFTRLVERILAHYLELTGKPGARLKDLRDQFTERLLRRRIEEYNHNYTAAIESLGMQRPTFYRLLKRFGIPFKQGEKNAAGPTKAEDEDE